MFTTAPRTWSTTAKPGTALRRRRQDNRHSVYDNLVLIDEADLLPRLFGQVLVPPAVHTELNDAESPSPVRAWVAAAPPWFRIRRFNTVRIPYRALSMRVSGGQSPWLKSGRPITCSCMS